MRTFSITNNGVELPGTLKEFVDKFQGKEATKDMINYMDDEVTFIVVDLGIAHGNLNKTAKDAWFCHRSDPDGFTVNVKW